MSESEEMKIIRRLQSLEQGDEITVEAENGYKDNRTIFLKEGDTLTFGDPTTEPSRIIDAEAGTIHRFPESPDDLPVAGWKITKLWVFDDE